MKLLVELEHKQEGVTHRPASLYRFDENRYQTLQAEGFNFEL
jgi:8-oxo-dGTP diphosphatase